MLRLLWKLIPKPKRELLFAQMPALERQYYNDVLNHKPLPLPFRNTGSIFIHIPKCAGLTVKKSLYGDFIGGHRSARSYQLRYPDEYNQYFTFSFVRNPWDRLVSAWKYSNATHFSNKQNVEWQQTISRFASFQEFVLEWLFLENVTRRIHLTPQSHFLLDKNGIISIDHVAKVENFEEEFNFIAKRLNIPVEIHSHNRTRTDDDYRSHFTSEMIDRVYDVYKTDIILLNYQFE